MQKIIFYYWKNTKIPEVPNSASFIRTSNHFLPHNFQENSVAVEKYFLFIQNIFRSQLKNAHKWSLAVI